MSIDPVKCFNLLPHRPLAAFLVRCGMPPKFAEAWISSTRKVERYPCFLSSLEAGIPGCTGAPEGDPLSVVAMAAVFQHLLHFCAHQNLCLATYVDNWSWQTPDAHTQLESIPSVLKFVSTLRLQIDWQKTWMWATTPSARNWWKKQGQSLFPTSVTIPVAASKCELGVPYQFQKSHQLVTRNHRLQHGFDRLNNLSRQPRPLLEKAYLVQTAVWPSCLYGAEGHCHSLAELARLRGAATKALLGDHKNTSPFLALGAITHKVQDPQLYVVEQQLRQLCRTLHHDAVLGLQILDDASHHRGRTAYGPAGSLAPSLSRIGVQLSADGILKGPSNHRLDLCTSTRHNFVYFCRRHGARRSQQSAATARGSTRSCALILCLWTAFYASCVLSRWQ